MTTLNYFCWLCLLFMVLIVEIVQPTCVLESDFGFKINCAFKKSGLFRVRNLGGIKAHASLGFSLGDELGFEQSLTNLDSSRRRSVSVKNGAPPNFITDASVRPAVKQEKRGKQNRIMMRPMAPASRPNQAAMDKLSSLHHRASSTMRPIVVSGSTLEAPNRGNPAVTMAKPLPMGVPPFKPLPPKEDTLAVLPIASSTRKSYTPLQVPTSKGPAPIYQSENYPRISQEHVSKMVSQMTAIHVASPQFRITPTPIMINTPKLYSVKPNANTFVMPTTLNPFVPMPLAAPPTQALTIIPAPVLKSSMQSQFDPSKTPTYSTQNQNSFSFQSKTPTYSAQNQNSLHFQSKTPTYSSQNQNSYSFQKTNPVSNFIDPVPHQVHDLASMYPVYNTKKVDDFNSISGYGDDTTLKFNKEDINAKIAEIAKAGNISMEAVEAAIALRQQQLLNKYANLPVPTTTSSTTTTTTTTTTEEPFIFQQDPEPEIVVPTIPQKPKRNPTSGKVMNAPKEYYPVGYEKNFDDHFQSKVDLPETSFHCGDQKYFPGLYGDESLGCMVFHVCALTDDGLVMKSFLCPESTLFDQTILKCNWWFYVDCKNTRRLYDTNIPVSKSYQLMKALTFFSSYKKEMQDEGHNVNPEEVEGIKEAISILENHNAGNKQGSVHREDSTIQVITPQPFLDERNNHEVQIINETSPVYRGNRNYNESSRKSSVKRKASAQRPEPQLQTSEFKLVTVNADMNFSKKDNSAENSSRGSSESSERKHRRRMTLKNNAPTTTHDVNVITNTTMSTSTPAVPVGSQEFKTITTNQTVTKQERLTDQLESADSINPIAVKDISGSPPVKRFYRSSAESTNTKDALTMVNNEMIQIVTPTSMAKLVGEHATPAATIEKLDEAILGPSALLRVKKAAVPHKTENVRSKPSRYGT